MMDDQEIDELSFDVADAELERAASTNQHYLLAQFRVFRNVSFNAVAIGL